MDEKTTYFVKLRNNNTKIQILSKRKLGIMLSIDLDDATYYQLQQNINAYLLSNVVIENGVITSLDIEDDPNWISPSTVVNTTPTTSTTTSPSNTN